MLPQSSDGALFEAWRAGDETAGRALFRRHVGSVTRFFRSKLGSDFDDLVQATFVACLTAANRLCDPDRFRAFLLGIARNVLLEHFKKTRRRNEKVDPLTHSVEELTASASSKLHRKRAEQRVLNAMRAAPLDDQIVLELHYWEELSTAEIATALGIPQGTVKGRLQRARKRLAEALGDPEIAADAFALRVRATGHSVTESR